MGLIDEDALMSAVMAQEVVDKSVAKRLILQVPTVDAVQVVRCGDCKWWCTDCMPEELGWCDATVNRSTYEDWYCADGVRSEKWQSKK